MPRTKPLKKTRKCSLRKVRHKKVKQLLVKAEKFPLAGYFAYNFFQMCFFAIFSNRSEISIKFKDIFWVPIGTFWKLWS